jgi:transmembrane sensor
MNTLPRHPAADEQASLWAARLDGSELTAADRAALDAWLAADPAHRALLSRYCQFSADLEQSLPALVASGAVALSAADTPRRRGWGFNWIAGGALAAAAAAALVVWLAWPATQLNRIATPAAQRQAITLADGTRVELNARTSLQAEIGRRERRVRLADGEAFFTVSKDPSRPFIVETPAGSVRVTGTVFNVRSEAATQLEVTVVEGSVQVRASQDGGAPHALGARDQLSSDASGTVMKTLSAAALESALAWREGAIVFERVPLRAAVARFARYHGRGIVVATAVDAKDPRAIGGRYSLDDLDGFLSFIETSWPDVRVTHESSGTVRLALRSQP